MMMDTILQIVANVVMPYNGLTMKMNRNIVACVEVTMEIATIQNLKAVLRVNIRLTMMMIQLCVQRLKESYLYHRIMI